MRRMGRQPVWISRPSSRRAPRASWRSLRAAGGRQLERWPSANGPLGGAGQRRPPAPVQGPGRHRQPGGRVQPESERWEGACRRRGQGRCCSAGAALLSPSLAFTVHCEGYKLRPGQAVLFRTSHPTDPFATCAGPARRPHQARRCSARSGGHQRCGRPGEGAAPFKLLDRQQQPRPRAAGACGGGGQSSFRCPDPQPLGPAAFPSTLSRSSLPHRRAMLGAGAPSRATACGRATATCRWSVRRPPPLKQWRRRRRAVA